MFAKLEVSKMHTFLTRVETQGFFRSKGNKDS